MPGCSTSTTARSHALKRRRRARTRAACLREAPARPARLRARSRRGRRPARPIEADAYYHFRPASGVIEAAPRTRPALCSGAALLALRARRSDAARAAAKTLRAPAACGARALPGRPRARTRARWRGQRRRFWRFVRVSERSFIALGVNIDHVATLRQARGARYPDPVHAALMAEQAGADSITLHLREDRRHIQDQDVRGASRRVQTRMNLEMAVTDEMLAIARARAAAGLLPRARERARRSPPKAGSTSPGSCSAMREAVRVARAPRASASSLFIDPDPRQIEAARAGWRAGHRAAHRRAMPRRPAAQRATRAAAAARRVRSCAASLA